MASKSSLRIPILPADDSFCQLYSTRACGCTQREFPGTMAQVEIVWEECSFGQKGGTAHLSCPWKVFLPLPSPPFMFMPSLSTEARLSLNFLLSCPQKCSLPGPCTTASIKKGTTLAVLRVSISPPAPSAQASASWPPSLECFPAWFRTQVSPLLCFCVSVFYGHEYCLLSE